MDAVEEVEVDEVEPGNALEAVTTDEATGDGDVDVLTALRKRHAEEDAKKPAWTPEDEEERDAAEAEAEAAKPKRGDDGKFQPSPAKQYERAKAALLRDGTYDEDEINAMAKDKVIAKGTIAAKRQSDLDRKLAQKAASPSEEVGSGEATDDAPPAPKAEAKSDGTTSGDDDLTGAVDAVAQSVSRLFGDDFGFGKTLKDLLVAERTTSRTAMAKVLDANARLEAQLNAITDKSIKKELVAQFPQVGSADNWQSVDTYAKSLLDAKLAPTREQALRDSALKLFGEEAIKAAARAQANLNAAKSRGQPHTATRTNPPTKGTQGQDPDEIALQRLRAGDSVRDVRAQFAG